MLIGLHGRKQAGKDTVYERARRIMDGVLSVERASFADLLYESAAASLGVPVGILRSAKLNPAYTITLASPYEHVQQITVREYLQRYGTEAHRDVFGPDFWVDNVRLDHAGKLVMVTDVRFTNEARAVRRAGGIVVRVMGPDAVELEGDGHASEKPLPHELVDEVVFNRRRDDGFRALDDQVHELLRGRLLRAAP